MLHTNTIMHCYIPALRWAAHHIKVSHNCHCSLTINLGKGVEGRVEKMFWAKILSLGNHCLHFVTSYSYNDNRDVHFHFL